MKRLIAAFLIAPIAPACILLPFVFNAAALVLFIFCFVAVFAYIATLIFGIPTYYLLRKKSHMQHASTYVFLAALIGIVTPLIITIPGTKTSESLYTFWFISAPYGALSGYVFWRIAHKTILANAEKFAQENPVHA
jgi:hypothetical protein